MNHRENELMQLYSSYCSFGAGKNGSSEGINGLPQMDNARFAKLARDCILDKVVTSTDVDITFNKVKAKTARKLEFSNFKEALRVLAEKKYNAPAETAYPQLVNAILKKAAGPSINGTVMPSSLLIPQVAATGGVFDKLTDTSKYTGTHKARFDADGKGKGLEGRYDIAKPKGIGASSSGDVRGSNSSLTKPSGSIGSLNKPASNNPSVKRNTDKLSNDALSKPAPKKAGGAVFDRLTDSSKYTGAHKHRFNEDGTGRGIAGRDSVPKGANPGTYRGGDVKDLSQILRS